ncbi:uncharacterized protein PAE49_004338 isoform 1-T1 [Odontesthes bonariensis]|uniref:uncharacterized protein LOC142378615 isoform X1 n=1 Tax=Odontesthes bonariensis TaxID=219752 RepID=UPI003F5846AF
METRMIVISLCLGTILSAAEGVKENLTGVVGGSIRLPDSMLDKGFLLYNRNNIASVKNREFEIEEDIYLNKLLWDKETGLFTITDLQRNDSGVYKFDSKKGRVFTSSYKLTVYDSVPSPAVNTLSVSSDSCSLLCSVHKETTLLWFKGERILNRSLSASSLPLTVNTEDFSSSYRCVAASPAENKTLTVNINASCSEEATRQIPAENKIRHYYWLIGLLTCIGSLGFVALAVCVIKKRCLPGTKRTISQTQDYLKTNVQYAEIQSCGDRHIQGGNFPDSSGAVEPSCLTTVCYRCVSLDAAAGL